MAHTPAIIDGPKGGTLYFKIEPFILGSFHHIIFNLLMGQSNWLVATKIK
jgi:hypothetical protein